MQDIGPGDIQIRIGITDAQAEAAARLYWQAFGSKLGRVLGPEPRALRFILRVMRCDHAVMALDGRGVLVGVVGFRSASGAFVGGTMADLRAVYGALGAAWRARALSLLAQELPTGMLAVDGLVVTEDGHGRGIGTALMRALADDARRSGYHHLMLDVVDGNDRARALYDRLGFRPTKELRSRGAALIFGIRGTTTMTCDL